MAVKILLGLQSHGPARAFKVPGYPDASTHGRRAMPAFNGDALQFAPLASHVLGSKDVPGNHLFKASVVRN